MAAAAKSFFWYVVATALIATVVSCYCGHAPSISSISPGSATAGSSQFTLTINGSDFSTTSVVNFSGSSLSPTFVNSHQLVVTIPATEIAQAGTLQVLVLTPPSGTGTTTSTIGGTTTTTETSTNTCGGSDSNAVSFTVSPTTASGSVRFTKPRFTKPGM